MYTGDDDDDDDDDGMYIGDDDGVTGVGASEWLSTISSRLLGLSLFLPNMRLVMLVMIAMIVIL